MTINKNGLLYCVIVGVLLCIAQMSGRSVFIGTMLCVFLLLLAWQSNKKNTLPILLFFLPWSALMKLSPGSISVYTVGLMMVCIIAMIRSKFLIGIRELIIGMILLLITLVSKLLESGTISLGYLSFMAMIFLLPTLQKEDDKDKSVFFTTVIYLSVGLILATFFSQFFANDPNIKRYVTILSYNSLTRMSGFNNDPNYYAAQITAALSGTLLMMLRGSRKQIITAAVLSIFLIYSGLITVSKTFFLVFAAMLIIWFVLLLRIQGKVSTKLIVITITTVMLLFIVSSNTFQQLFGTILNRFSMDTDMRSFTTGRTSIWGIYLREIFDNWKILFFGKGLTSVTVEGYSTHNILIELLFQFGLIGIPFVILWVKNLSREISIKEIIRKRKVMDLLILTVGIVVPWLSISILFFDEFFLFQWFLILGINELCSTESKECIEKI